MKIFILTLRYLLIMVILTVMAFFCLGNTVYLYMAATFVCFVILMLSISGNVEEKQMKVLIYAACKGKTEQVKDLLKCLKHFDIKGDDGSLALRGAAGRGYEDIVRLLLEYGADANATDNGGVSALMRAAAGGHLGTVKLLLAAGANAQAKDEDGDTALTKATENGNQDIIDLLS